MSVGYLVQALLCLKMHHIAPKMQHTETENLKNLWGGGTAPSPNRSLIGEGDTSSPNPTPLGAFGASILGARPAAPPLSSFAPLSPYLTLLATGLLTA